MKNIKTNEDRIMFLGQFGVTVDPTALEEEEIKIPDTFDKVYMGYNEIQRAQGLDLSKYKNKKVLIVDDSTINLKVAVQVLKPYNFEIITATSGQEAIEKVKTNIIDLNTNGHNDA